MEEEVLMLQAELIIQRILNNPITSNCFVIHDANKNECVVIDPGTYDNSELRKYLLQNKLSPSIIILTHEHFDHIWGVQELSFTYNFQLICNQVCAGAILNPKKNLSLFYNNVGFSIDIQVSTIESLNYKLDWFGHKFYFINTPGHSEGSIVIQLSNFLFCGDLMIQNEMTVTKLPGGSKSRLNNSLTMLKLLLSSDTILHSGHGDNFVFKNYFLYNKF